MRLFNKHINHKISILYIFLTLLILLLSSVSSAVAYDKIADEWKSLRIVESYHNVASCYQSINILVQYVNAKTQEELQKNFFNFILTLISRTRCLLHIYIISNEHDKVIAEDMFLTIKTNFKWLIIPKRTYLNFENISNKFLPITTSMKELFSSSGESYYKQSLFYLPLLLHRILPYNITKLIMFDVDIQVRGDVKYLHKHFDAMNDNQVMGLALEQQPTYYHVTTEYREGNPQIDYKKFIGFNSGTKLLNFDKIRKNILYNTYVNDTNKLLTLANKYYFRGHLGDQDFYTLLSFEYPELYYLLPCQWNRQLCTWWRKAYNNIFEDFHFCEPPYFIVHGNCGTPIPIE